jgi:DNA-3-methyladenine glycosylase II
MPDTRRAVAHLERADPTLAAVIGRVGACRFEPRAEGTHFEAVARAIVYQQLSGKAAGTITAASTRSTAGGARAGRAPRHRRRAAPRPPACRARSSATCATSPPRARRRLPLDRVEALADDEIVAALTRVKGVGRWTAQMFLMFRLGRPDVLPDLDLGVQKAIQLAYGLPRHAEARRRAAHRRAVGAAPHRRAWYLWRFLDNGGGQLGD